jgi:FkbM family methyltransferase
VPPWLFRVVPSSLYHRVRRMPLLGRLVRALFDVVLPPRGLVLVRVQRGPLSGMVLELDPRTQIDVVVGRYERRVARIVERVLTTGQTAFDIGAHLGYFTLMMALVVGRDGRVVSFEPDPTVMEGLGRNLRRNGAQAEAEILLLPAAVDDRPGRSGFVAGRETSRGKLVTGLGDIEVETMMLDDVARQFGRPRLAKIDVEGRELGVLRGASETLRARETVFVIEAHSGGTERACRELMTSFAYDTAVVAEAGRAESYVVAWPASEPSPVEPVVRATR